jgi:predicted deacylase
VESPGKVFPVDYADARRRFLSLASAAGFQIESHVHPRLCGPAGEELACDVARRGPDDAREVLLVASGTHGVEGFCGSGCQAALLRSPLPARLPPGTALVLVHAVNPFGFAWLRRTNEDNIDLNRKFVDHARVPGNPAYDEIHDWLVPREWEGPVRDAAEAAIARYIEERGMRAFQVAFTGGQYTHPDGLFYGGTAPAWSNTIWRSILRQHVGPAARLVGIDLHTGLGPRGVGEALCATDEAEYHRARALLGEEITWTGGTGSVSAQIGGSLFHAAQQEIDGGRATMIGLEYGTYPIPVTLEALRAENWLEARGQPGAEQGRRIKQALKGAFYIDEADWHQAVLERFFSIMERVIERRGA